MFIGARATAKVVNATVTVAQAKLASLPYTLPARRLVQNVHSVLQGEAWKGIGRRFSAAGVHGGTCAMLHGGRNRGEQPLSTLPSGASINPGTRHSCACTRRCTQGPSSRGAFIGRDHSDSRLLGESAPPPAHWQAGRGAQLLRDATPWLLRDVCREFAVTVRP